MEIVYYVACSLDGYIATTEGSVDWLESFDGGGEYYGYEEFNQSIDALVMGSGSYEFVLQHGDWPYADKPCWVFTSRSMPVAHPSVTLTQEDPGLVVDSLRERGFRKIWLVGGGALAGSFSAQNLITEYMITIIPVLLGEGIRLFEGTPGTHTLSLVDSKRYSDGVVQLVHRPTDNGD